MKLLLHILSLFCGNVLSAASCEHASIVRLLMLHGANTSLTDSDGSSALDITDNDSIAALLASR